ncbi:hypothetical protein TVAG_391180 [Trichomonas vaginalis G3]|uniref:Uncharacterized protein n=1 Tax=Trichomonas vaginalis (strain ATCC PRA-98 / G3) TaxID=412133 RepID=A2DFN1_TRIV3|nr:hypothetical protein TVAGG3_0323800 [Trichomonas vaginalis G3]EAY20734.1 hypothetical protein TVAG_391180 [Trichomonas vaginalis G3]KAI5529491.1 hypothetical protein TVAGG3_0323800 [Trichomonas vaginalis G3]|eukprot:XP_001581720.1 hypothetical protein [Trichomonas vaginalis G3]
MQTMNYFSSQPNYYNVITEIKNNAESKRIPSYEYKTTLQRALLKKSPQNDTQLQSQKSIEEALKNSRMGRDATLPDSKQIYEDFLNLVKDRLSPEQHPIFIRYLSVYMSGCIPHKLFIRLFYQLIGKVPLDDPIMLNFPSFLASVSFNTFTTIRENYTKPEDEACAEIVIITTVNASTPEEYHSIYKAFKLLSEGYISTKIAKNLLSKYCPEETLNKLDTIENFAIFNPDRIPHEYILCSDFTNPLNEKDAITKFETNPAKSRISSLYESTPFETIENQLQSTKKLIEMFILKEIPTQERLIPFFGIKSGEVLEQFPKFNQLAIKRLIQVYQKFFDNYKEFSYHRLNRLTNNYLEYRITYKKVLKILYDPVHMKIPGVHTIHLGNTEQIAKAHHLIDDFIYKIFAGDEKLKNNFELVKNVLFNGKPLEGNDALISYCLALSELIKTIDGFDTTEITNAIKTEDGLLKLYSSSEMRCVDLILIKAVRAINKISEISEFGIESIKPKQIYLTCIQVNGKDATVETQITPLQIQPAEK